MRLIEDPFTMKYSEKACIFPIAVQLVFLILVSGVLTFANPEPVDESDRLGASAVFLIIMIGLPWILFIEFAGTQINVDDIGIHIRSYWRRGRSIEWHDIKKIRYNALGDSLVIIGSRRKIGFHLAISDRVHWIDFLKILHEKVPPEKIQDEDIREGILKAIADAPSGHTSEDS